MNTKRSFTKSSSKEAKIKKKRLIALLFRNFLVIKGFNNTLEHVEAIIASLGIIPISYADLVTKVNNNEL
jgi:hypothetical protein